MPFLILTIFPVLHASCTISVCLHKANLYYIYNILSFKDVALPLHYAHLLKFVNLGMSSLSFGKAVMVTPIPKPLTPFVWIC